LYRGGGPDLRECDASPIPEHGRVWSLILLATFLVILIKMVVDEVDIIGLKAIVKCSGYVTQNDGRLIIILITISSFACHFPRVELKCVIIPSSLKAT